MEREGAAFWKRKDINAAQSSMKWWKRSFLAGNEAAIERFWAYQSYIIYWRGVIPGGLRVGRFIVRKQKRAPPPPSPPLAPLLRRYATSARARPCAPFRRPRPPLHPEVPQIWTPQIELDWS